MLENVQVTAKKGKGADPSSYLLLNDAPSFDLGITPTPPNVKLNTYIEPMLENERVKKNAKELLLTNTITAFDVVPLSFAMPNATLVTLAIKRKRKDFDKENIPKEANDKESKKMKREVKLSGNVKSPFLERPESEKTLNEKNNVKALSYFIDDMEFVMKSAKVDNISNIDMVFLPVLLAKCHYYLLVFNLKTLKIEILDNSTNGINVSVDDLYGESFKKLKKRFIEYLAYSEQRSWKSMKKAVCERIEMSWKTEYNVIDCGIFMMRHMETFMGYAKNWKCGFKNEGWEHKTQIYDLRKKYL
ncbi:ulp1 protease family, C-terminal catalytic domain-containing protein, partial [Tanacetum coccineum]